MPMWNSLQNTATVNLTYHPFGIAQCQKQNDGIKCQCQHGNQECIMNQLQACVIAALEVPQLYMRVVNCIQGKRDINKAMGECIVNARPRPDLDERFIQNCAQSQLGAKLMYQHGQRQHKIARDLNWVPWIMVNGAREQKAEISMNYVLCKFASLSSSQYCQQSDDNI
ncbi:unnamed protein product [Caenorhabditis angaria]|uniref:Uncharacterized protein n=1 Tax=Caenorhabditis angaria TaxID=860376 RepID=A0A9P1IBX1_9PELO|nr:unnamed protein product [Caenorhabditis angaria]